MEILVSELKKAYRFEKNVKLSLFIDDIVYVENLREATKKGFRDGKFIKVSGSKVNIKISVVFLYIDKPLGSEIKNTICKSIKNVKELGVF